MREMARDAAFIGYWVLIRFIPGTSYNGSLYFFIRFTESLPEIWCYFKNKLSKIFFIFCNFTAFHDQVMQGRAKFPDFKIPAKRMDAVCEQYHTDLLV